MVNEFIIREAVSQKAHMNVAQVTGEEKEKLTGLEETMRSRIIGQDHSIHLIVNAQVREFISLEYASAGQNFPGDSVQGPGARSSSVSVIDTAMGPLQIVVDPYLSMIAGTPNSYPTILYSADKASWQYIEPLDAVGPEPKVFQFPRTNTLDDQYKGVMFGALELLGADNHFKRLNVEHRDVVVNPTATE